MRGVCCCERRDADGRDEAGNGILHPCSPEKPRADACCAAASRHRVMAQLVNRVLRIANLARGLVWMAGEDVAPAAEAGLLIPVNQLRFARWVRQGGRNAFNRDWSCCCGWAFARNHGTDPIGAGERRSPRSSRGGNGSRDPGALLVHVAWLARLLPALALLVRGPQTSICHAEHVSRAAPINNRTYRERAGPTAPGAFSFEAEIAALSDQRVCGAARLIGGRVTVSW